MTDNIKIISARHAWGEKAGFALTRPTGHPSYTFLHFFSSVSILVGGETVTTAPHSCIIYDIGTPQQFRSEQTLIHDWIHLSGDLMSLLDRIGIAPDTLYYPSKTDFITTVIREIEIELVSGMKEKDRMLGLKAEELFIKLSRVCSSQEKVRIENNVSERMRNLRSEMFSCLDSDWNVEKMAHSVGLSESRFYAVYKAEFSVSPVEDLICARIDSAKNALSYSSQSVSEIAEMLGYNNPTHFIRQFHDRTGVSPSVFRKKLNE